MKKCLMLLAIALTVTFAKAENYALKVNLFGSTSATYVLETKPVISYSENNVIIKNESLEDTYSINEIESFTFVENQSTGIESVKESITYEYRNNIFTCEGRDIRVFNLSGQTVVNGNGSVSLEGLADGFYIVNAGGRAIKVVKK